MIALLIACASAPNLTIVCSDSSGEVFRSTCPADMIRIESYRSGGRVRATCGQSSLVWSARFMVDADRCIALPPESTR